MGATESGIEQVGSGCLDIGTYLLGGGAISPTIRVKDMGPDAAYGESVGRIPPQGDLQDYRKTTVEGEGLGLGLSPSGRCDGGVGFAGG